VPIYIKGSKYFSLFELLVSVAKINCGNYLINYNNWHSLEQEIHIKKDKFDSQALKKQANQLAHIINNNKVFMNVIDDLPEPEFHYVSFAEWEKFKTEGRKWSDRRIIVCQTRSTVYVSEPLPLWGVHKVNFD